MDNEGLQEVTLEQIKRGYTGKGVYIFTRGDRYEGDFLNGYMDGKGFKKTRNGEIEFHGEYKNDKPIGFSKIKILDSKRVRHEFLRKDDKYYYGKKYKKPEEFSIKNNKRLEEGLLQLGSGTLINEYIDFNNSDELNTFINEELCKGGNRVFGIGFPGHVSVLLFEEVKEMFSDKINAYLFDNGGLKDSSLSDYMKVIIQNKDIKYKELKLKNNISFELNNGEKVEIPLDYENNSVLVCRNVANTVYNKLKELMISDKRGISDEFGKYCEANPELKFSSPKRNFSNRIKNSETQFHFR